MQQYDFKTLIRWMIVCQSKRLMLNLLFSNPNPKNLGVTRVADAVSALPLTTEFQVKPDRTGL